MNNENKRVIRDAMVAYLDHLSKVLPDDVDAALRRLREAEHDEAALRVYDTMFQNAKLASELGRPMCQDTGILQFRVVCGGMFPAINELKDALIDAVEKATTEVPLRPNVVISFEERNTGSNTGDGAPVIWWDIEPDRDDCEIDVYMAGGGTSLPGRAEVLMPGAGYEAVIPYVLDRAAEYGPNACPPLLIGVGIGNSVETAAMNSKSALLRRIGSKNDNPKAAMLEELLEEGLNAMGLGPQGFGGSASVMGVNVVSTARHPATLAVAVNFGCWCHRRGRLSFDSKLNYSSETHSSFAK